MQSRFNPAMANPFQSFTPLLLTLVIVITGGLMNIQLWQQHNEALSLPPLPLPELQPPELVDPFALADLSVFHSSPSPEEVSLQIAQLAGNNTPRLSKLDLNVLGIVHNQGDIGVAIISHQGETSSYFTGDTLLSDDSVRLIQVRPTSIIVSQNGNEQKFALAEQRYQHRQSQAALQQTAQRQQRFAPRQQRFPHIPDPTQSFDD